MNKFYCGVDSIKWLELLENGKLDANTAVTPFKEVAQNFGSVILEIEASEFVRGKNYFKIGETPLDRVSVYGFEEDC